MNTPRPVRALAAAACLALVLILAASAAALAGTHGQAARVRGPIECGPVYCHRQVTITRPWLDTSATVTIVKQHARPVESRTAGTPAPWGPWRLVVAYIR